MSENVQQRWKVDPTLYSCETTRDGYQTKKMMDYESTYVNEFLNKDPMRDWESFDRCRALWFWGLRKAGLDHIADVTKFNVLDCGTKDGQFPEFLDGIVDEVLGIELSMPYVEFANERNRPVVYGDVCKLTDWFDWRDHFDFVFSHHLLGLTPDYLGALEEMLAVTKKNGYMITCNDVPGNPKKHFSYIETSKIFDEFVSNSDVSVIHNDRWHPDFAKEWVLFVQKN